MAHIKRIVIYDNYTKLTGHGDVALLQLTEPLANTIPLARFDDNGLRPLDGDAMRVAGWGDDSRVRKQVDPIVAGQYPILGVQGLKELKLIKLQDQFCMQLDGNGEGQSICASPADQVGSIYTVGA